MVKYSLSKLLFTPPPTSVDIGHSVKVNRVFHKGTTTTKQCSHKLKSWLNRIKEDPAQRHRKARWSVWGWISRARGGPLTVPNTRDQSYALSTNKMVTSPPLLLSLTDSLTSLTSQPLRIIIWPRALMGINRLGHLACMSPSSPSSLMEHDALVYSLQRVPEK